MTGITDSPVGRLDSQPTRNAATRSTSHYSQRPQSRCPHARRLGRTARPGAVGHAGGDKHHGFKHHGYSYGYYYRPAYVYRAPTCQKYAWVWKHGYKRLVCVHYW